MAKTTKKLTKKVVKKVAKKVTKSVKKSEKKSDIWIVIIQLNGSINYQKINNEHYYYQAAITSGNYTLTEEGSKQVVEEGKKVYEAIRKSEKSKK